MGKAQKQSNNRMSAEIERLKQDADFIEMITQMQPGKMYNLKRKEKHLFNGKQFHGSVWKKLFLNENPTENDSTEN